MTSFLSSCSHTIRRYPLLPLCPPAGGTVHPSVSSVRIRTYWRRYSCINFSPSCNLMCWEATRTILSFPELLPGQFGKVYKANLKRDVKEIKVAVKTIQRYTSEKETQDFMHEMSIMADMMHPNIIRLYGLVSKGQSLSICN